MVVRSLAIVAVVFAWASGALQGQQLSQDENGKVPKGARVFIGPIGNGFDIYLTAAIQKKEVPIVITTNQSTADFELSGVTESEKAGWAKTVFWGSTSTAEQASVKL